jgi:hypothetical protein
VENLFLYMCSIFQNNNCDDILKSIVDASVVGQVNNQMLIVRLASNWRCVWVVSNGTFIRNVAKFCLCR